MNRQVKIFFVAFLLVFVPYIAIQSNTTVEAAKHPNEQRLRQLLNRIAQEKLEQAWKTNPSTNKIVALAEKKTPTRIVVFNHELISQEVTELENIYKISFTKQKVGKNGYVVQPKDESLYDSLMNNPSVVKSYNNTAFTIKAQDWGIDKINTSAAWAAASPVKGENVVVAIIDTGVQLDHSDLSGAILPAGKDFINNDNDPSDDHGHGTHIAGIIAARDNSIGYVGVAPNVDILPLKVCNQKGICDAASIVNAIDYAITQNVDIINMSFGVAVDNGLIHDAIDRAYTAGILLVAAAGNSGENSCLYPAAYANVVCIGATDNADAKANFSNYGANLDIMAPGVAINSTYLGQNGYTSLDGTSMSTAYYSGASALVDSQIKALCVSTPSEPFCTDKNDYIAALMNATARDIGTPGTDIQTGHGLIDLSPIFVDTTSTMQTPTPTVKRGVSYTQNTTFTNNESYAVNLTSCTVKSQNTTRSQTVPTYTITTLAQGVTNYTNSALSTIYTTFTFNTPIQVASDTSINFTYTYSVSTEAQPLDSINLAFTCAFDNAATPATEAYHPTSTAYTATLDWPDTLKNVYYTFGKLRYGRYASPSQLRTGDYIYLKNYDPAKVRLLAISLYDYTIKGNQGYTRTWKSWNSMYMRTNYLLPTKRKYAFIFTFQDVATSVVIKKYFVVNTISPSTITY